MQHTDQCLIKVPITKNFLFSYLKLYLIKITSAKKFCDLNKTRFFYNFWKTFKFAAILHTIRLSLLSEYDVIWRTLRNTWPYRQENIKSSDRFFFFRKTFFLRRHCDSILTWNLSFLCTAGEGKVMWVP